MRSVQLTVLLGVLVGCAVGLWLGVSTFPGWLEPVERCVDASTLRRGSISAERQWYRARIVCRERGDGGPDRTFIVRASAREWIGLFGIVLLATTGGGAFAFGVAMLALEARRRRER